MKKYKVYILTLMAFAGLASCTSYTDELTDDAVTGGLLTEVTPLISYVVGNGDDFEYKASFTVFQGSVSTTKVDVYSSFTQINTAGDFIVGAEYEIISLGDADNLTDFTLIGAEENTLGTVFTATGAGSGSGKAQTITNEILLSTIDVPASPQHQTFNFSLTYPELIEGLFIAGVPLPAEDTGLNIGDSWNLRYVATTSNGNATVNADKTKISVSTRYAGNYKVLSSSQYWRIGVETVSTYGDWHGGERTVESVDATTYKFIDYAGPFFAVTNTHYFTIDSDLVVETPITYNGVAQLLNTFGVINCVDTPDLMTNACGVPGLQNTVVKDDVLGKDVIYRSYGYNTTTGAVGPREIYEVIEKVVD